MAARTATPEQLGKEGHWGALGKEMCIINVDNRGHDGRARHLVNVKDIMEQIEPRTVGAYRNLMYGETRHSPTHSRILGIEVACRQVLKKELINDRRSRAGSYELFCSHINL